MWICEEEICDNINKWIISAWLCISQISINKDKNIIFIIIVIDLFVFDEVNAIKILLSKSFVLPFHHFVFTTVKDNKNDI